MSENVLPGLVLAVAGFAGWVTVLVGAWLGPILPPAGPSFRVLRAAPLASAVAMWTTVAGLGWMAFAWVGGIPA